MSDDPLEPMESQGMYVAEVIDLAGMRIRFGLSPRNAKSCEHLTLIYSQTERRIWCEDCNRTIDNFDAFMGIVRRFERMLSEAQGKMADANEAMRSSARRRATKELDRAWSGHEMAVSCPHCRNGLLPEDFLRGLSMCSKEIELARRERTKTPPAE